jgi:hypothetical protein
MIITGIDPGPTESGVVRFDFATNVLVDSYIIDNDSLIKRIEIIVKISDVIVFEKIASLGMAVGADVFETVFWTGRLFERINPDICIRDRITRHEVKINICHSARAKDSNIRQALIDRFGKQGTKKNPGVLYGMKTHLWPALAVAATYYDTKR